MPADGKGAARKRASRTPARDEILGKYWELANLDPEVTKGTIAGQLKALDSLCEQLGLAPGPAGGQARAPAGGREIYRASWMDATPEEHD